MNSVDEFRTRDTDGLALNLRGGNIRTMIQATNASVWHSSLFGDEALAPLFSEIAFLDRFARFERALTAALRDHGLVEAAMAERALAAIAALEPDIAAIRAGLCGDGVPVPAFVRQLKAAAGDAAVAIHVGATSQDLVDTATVLALKEAEPVLRARLAAVLEAIDGLAARFGRRPLMGRTRMQAALPVTVGARLAGWSEPLRRHLHRLDAVAAEAAILQFGGPVGQGPPALGGKGPRVAESLAAELGLGVPDRPWHTDRSALLGYAHWLTLVTGTLGKMGQDVALMAQQEIDEIALTGGGTSSAMVHKQNPVLAEKLVTIARFNAAQIGGLQQAMVHEQERSGSAWMLEWMILPPMVIATGRALADAHAMLGSVTRLGEAD